MYVAGQVPHAFRQRFHVGNGYIRFGGAAVHFQRPDRGDYHHEVGVEPAHAAFDVYEFFRAQIGAETRLGYDYVGVSHGGFGGDDAVAAVRYVGERPAVHNDRRARQRLHQIRFDGLFHENRHGVLRAQVAGVYKFAVEIVAHRYVAHAFFKVVQAACQAHRRHYFACGGYVETVLAAAVFVAHGYLHAPQSPVVYIHRPAP